MHSRKLFDLLVGGGAFKDKNKPTARFRDSIKRNIKRGRITQADANGREMSAVEMKDLRSPSAIFSGITRLKR
jgi:hypothetical protein